jgi:ADP-ribosylglycohydrolase
MTMETEGYILIEPTPEPMPEPMPEHTPEPEPEPETVPEPTTTPTPAPVVVPRTGEEIKDTLCDSLFNTRLPINILIDRIKGLIYGCIIGECRNNTECSNNTDNFPYLTEQMLMSMETVIENGMYEPYKFLKKMKAYKGTHDKYTQEVLNTLEAEPNARINSINHYIKNEDAKEDNEPYIPTDGNTALVRVIPLCLYYNFDDLALISCMTTHANTTCLTASVIFATLIRNLLIGRPIIYEDLLLCFNVSLASSMKNIEHEEGYDNLVNYVPNNNYKNIDELELKDGDHVYKTLGVCIYSLMKTVEQNIMDSHIESPTSNVDNFNNIIEEVHSKGGDTITNCCITGAIVGCCIGYNNLPLDKIHLTSQNSAYIEKIVILYLHIFGIKTQ